MGGIFSIPDDWPWLEGFMGDLERGSVSDIAMVWRLKDDAEFPLRFCFRALGDDANGMTHMLGMVERLKMEMRNYINSLDEEEETEDYE